MTGSQPNATPKPAARNASSSHATRPVVIARQALGHGRSAFIRLFDQRGVANRRLVVGLGIVVGVACLLGLPGLLATFPAGTDFEIPMRAASRWAGGGQVYPASAVFQTGPDLPYLYPPYLLPFLVPLTWLPRAPLTGLWLIACCLFAVWTCRRLGIPWLAVPFVLAWPPFAEGLITGNVQILCFAAYVGWLYDAAAPTLRQADFPPARDARNGLLSAAVGVLKVGQLPTVLYLARRRPRAFAIAFVALATLTIVTLPLTGLTIYGDWLAQIQRVLDQYNLGSLLGLPEVLFMTLGVVIAITVRGRNSGAWLGIALVIASATVHGYNFLFLLPGLLLLRRDLAILTATLFLGVYHIIAWWMACVLVAYFLIAANHWTWLGYVRRAGPDEAAPISGSAGAAASRT